MAEKRICVLPAVRVEEPLEVALLRLSATADRKLSDYIRRVLWAHVHASAESVGEDDTDDKQDRAAHGDAKGRK
jgi:hypothetical protein